MKHLKSGTSKNKRQKSQYCKKAKEEEIDYNIKAI